MPRGPMHDASDVVLLCGGQGTRLRTVLPDVPKVLAPVGGVPFLDIVVRSLENSGFRRVIVSIGYLREQIERHVHDLNTNLETVVISEHEPLGTGGGLRNAFGLTTTDHIFVMNGDSLCKVDFALLHKFHLAQGGIMSMTLAPAPEGESGYGVVAIDDERKILSFEEKPEQGVRGFVSAGMYLMRRDIADYFPAQKNFSLEYDLFPAILDRGCYGFLAEGAHIDIGTPERYARANELAHIIKSWYGVT